MEEKGQYLIGMDGGGTKTSVVVKWADGREEEFLSGPFNINGQEKEETARTLEEIAAEKEGLRHKPMPGDRSRMRGDQQSGVGKLSA